MLSKSYCIVLLFILWGSLSALAQPAYWQFSTKDLIPSIEMGMKQTDVISLLVKKEKVFGKYSLVKQRVFVDSNINFIDHELLSGSFQLPPSHKLKEWFDPASMIINYNVLFVNGVCVRISLYFIYPSIAMGEIDLNYTELLSFFSQVGWYYFCGHSTWDLDVKCGYQANYVPKFEQHYGEDPNIRMYRLRLKVAKGLCKTSEHTLQESIEISFSDASFLQEALRIKSIEKAAFYGNALFGFGLDKKIPGGCASE